MQTLKTFFFLFVAQLVWAQVPLPKEVQESYDKAFRMKFAFENDSAIHYIDQVIQYLQQKKQLYTNFGIEILQEKAFFQEAAENNREAIKSLLYVIEIANKYKQYQALASAYISLARLYEKIGNAGSCFSNLKSAQLLITEHHLDTLKPRHYNRLASYYRVATTQKDSAFFFANKALFWGEKTKNEGETAVAHMLLGMLSYENSFVNAKDHFQHCILIWQKQKDYNGLQAILSNLSNLHLKHGYIEDAFHYNDSALVIVHKHLDSSGKYLGMVYNQYSRLYKQTNQLDSALYYQEKYYLHSMQYEREMNQLAIAKINAQFESEHHKRTIAEQAHALQKEKQQNILLAIIISFLVILSMVLAYFYYRLQKSKKRIEEHATNIKTINKNLSASLHQQKILLGEVHHRVKNNLQIVISMLELQAEEYGEPHTKQSYIEMANRIYSIAAIHEMMYKKEELSNLDLEQYIHSLCANIQHSINLVQRPTFEIQCPALSFNMETLIPLGIVLNELITNSIKHAKVITNDLIVTINLAIKQDGYLLSYHDNGQKAFSLEDVETSSNMGWYLIKSMARQLQGNFSIDNINNNTLINIFFIPKTLSYNAQTPNINC